MAELAAEVADGWGRERVADHCNGDEEGGEVERDSEEHGGNQSWLNGTERRLRWGFAPP